jgi:hypothetical protein
MQGAARSQWLFHWQASQRSRRRPDAQPEGPDGLLARPEPESGPGKRKVDPKLSRSLAPKGLPAHSRGKSDRLLAQLLGLIAVLALVGCHVARIDAPAAGERTDAPGAAGAFYLQKRLPPGSNELPVESLFAARAASLRMAQVSSLSGAYFPAGAAQAGKGLVANWTALGPGNIGGRTRALVIDPGNTSVLYAGGVGGGVWKSVDSGASWLPTADSMANLAIASLVMDPTNPQVLYAGTGEGFSNVDAIRGAGVFKTLDGGQNWLRLASTASWQFVNDLVISGLNHQRILAATSTGVWISQDGGANWARPLSTSNCVDLAASVVGGVETWLASCGARFQAGVVYRSTDLTNWPSVLAESGMSRVSIALRGSRAYAMGTSSVAGFDRTGDGIGDYTNQLHAFFRSDNSGQTWTPTVRNSDPHWGNSLLMSGYFSCETLRGGVGIGWYANALAIDPLDVDSVWAGSILSFRSDDGGFNWGRIDTVFPFQAHPDHHAIVFDPGFDGVGNQRVYITGDGGIHRSANARAVAGVMPPAPINDCAVPPYATQINWSELNNDYAVTQFYHGTPYPDGTRYLAGAQDNYLLRGSDSSGPNAWTALTCGDGGYSAIDPGDTQKLYAGCQYKDLRRSIDGGTQWLNGDLGITDTPNDVVFVPPFVLDPNQAQRLWFGGRRAWRTSDAAMNWSAASADFPTRPVSAIAVAPGNADRVLMGTANGRVYRSDSATTATGATVWSEATVNAGGYVSALAFEPGNASVVYATIATFGRPHVWKSIDGGTVWSNISGAGVNAIPDAPALSIVVDIGDLTRLFVGTDIGVFTSNDGGATWAVEITGFPNVSTEWLALTGDANTRSIFAFTHGRGAFRATLGPPAGQLLFSDGFE